MECSNPRVFSFPGPQPPQQFYASASTPRHPIFSPPSDSFPMRPSTTSTLSSSPTPFSLSQSSIGRSTPALTLRPSSFGFNSKPEQPMASSSSSHLYWSLRDLAPSTDEKQDSTPITASMSTGTIGCRLFGIDLVNCSNIEESVPSHITASRSRGTSTVIGHTTTPVPTSLDMASGSHGVGGGVTAYASISSMNLDAMVGSDVVRGRGAGSGETELALVPINQNSADVVTAAGSEQMLPMEFPPCRPVRSCTKVSLFCSPIAYILGEILLYQLILCQKKI